MENTNVTEQSTNEIMPMAASGETNFASLPEKATPASGDMFLMEDSEDTKKINYDKLADAILNKLTSKTYSGLETTAKNFVTAINELNSKSMRFYSEGSQEISNIHVEYAEKYFCVAAQQGPNGLSNTDRVFILEISNDARSTNIINIHGTALTVLVDINDSAITMTFGSSYIKLLMIALDPT